MDPHTESVFQVVKSNILTILPHLASEEITMDQSLVDMGANSVDRVEVVIYSMEQLNLKIPRQEFQGVSNIRGLVELLARHARAN